MEGKGRIVFYQPSSDKPVGMNSESVTFHLSQSQTKGKYINIYFSIACFFTMASCKNRMNEVIVDGYKVRGDIEVIKNDTIFDGPIEYYDSNNRLAERSEFHANKRQGISTAYYPNGKIWQIKTYLDGYENGESVTYDILGKITQKSNYYHDLDMGSEEFYKYGSLAVYRFLSFEGYPIYRGEYDTAKGLLETGRLLFYVSNFSDDDNKMRIKVFLYLMSPPGKALTYKIFDTDMKSKDTLLLNTFKKIDFKEFTTFYLNLPKENHKYFFEVEAFYSNGRKTVKNILKPEDCDLVMPGTK